jgi:hypothetical protein
MSDSPATPVEGEAAASPDAPPPKITTDDASAIAAAKDRKKRRAHKRGGGSHEELNIYSMLDLMTIILVFLIKQWQSDTITLSPDVSPPASTITEKPSESLRIFITSTTIVLDDKEVARMENGDVAASDLESGLLIPRLQQGMTERAEQFLRIERAGGAKFEGKYAIVADRKLTWAVLKKIMFTAGQVSLTDEAGEQRSFGDAKLVTKKNGE